MRISDYDAITYDPEEGRVITSRYWDGAIRHAIEVRKAVEDAAILEAVLVELRRRGFVVTRPEESTPTREAIIGLQDQGYVVREAEDFQATLKAERERVYDAYTHLICEEMCRCIQCLREAVEGDETE